MRPGILIIVFLNSVKKVDKRTYRFLYAKPFSALSEGSKIKIQNPKSKIKKRISALRHFSKEKCRAPSGGVQN